MRTPIPIILFTAALGWGADRVPSSRGGFPTFIGPVGKPHPDYRLFSLTPEGHAFKVIGMDWYANGDLAILTIGDTVAPESGGGKGTVYRLKGAREATSNALAVETVYSGFKVPMGLAVAEDQVYVSDFNGLQRLVDTDGDDRADSLERMAVHPGISNVPQGLWNAALIHTASGFYTALGAHHYVDSAWDSGACDPDPARGTIRRMDAAGRMEDLGSGLREPFGIVETPEGDVFATDNDGEWVPSNKLVHVQLRADFRSRTGADLGLLRLGIL